MWWNFTDESWLNGMLYCCIDCIDCIHTVAYQYSSFWCTSCTSSFWKKTNVHPGVVARDGNFWPCFSGSASDPDVLLSAPQAGRADRLYADGEGPAEHWGPRCPNLSSRSVSNHRPSFKTIQCEGFCSLLWRQIISSSDTMIWCFILATLWKTIQCGGFCLSLWNIATTLCAVKKWL